ncbi:magnesium transporter CorA family protein [Bauldia litoralis]|uniref:Magnesium transport protein CorA n=1 Tax=Bauldia litoralis TaxID=665467 RepID=A0A1G6DTM4_9HYPH|nr:magnesium transporter CorA family protein [Bauldia litoralis]SDB48523.1 magnesium transporter [Bauldia litoralis]
MLDAYTLSPGGPKRLDLTDGGPVPEETRWVDLVHPTPSEDAATEVFLSASLPTREEASEIEFSSRFYSEDGAVFMTATVLTGVDKGEASLVPLTIVVTGDQRIATLRYDDLRALHQFLARASKPGSRCGTIPSVFLGLIEAVVDRTADVLERISADVDRINRDIFAARTERRGGLRLEQLIGDVGTQGDLAAKARESLASIERLIQFASLTLPGGFTKGVNKNRLKLIARDVRSLEDHVGFLSNKITFLLDATLGLISVEQNEVIRVLTIAATIFFPPTLIGTVYGMNFTDMPELSWQFGYPVAIGLMVASAVLPYLYFKRRGWL